MKTFGDFIESNHTSNPRVDDIVVSIQEYGFKKTPITVKSFVNIKETIKSVLQSQPSYEHEVLRIPNGGGKSIDFCVTEKKNIETSQRELIMSLQNKDILVRSIGNIPSVEDAKIWVESNKRIVRNPDYHHNPSVKMEQAAQRQYDEAKKKMVRVKLNPKTKIGYTITTPEKDGNPGKIIKRKDVPGKPDLTETVMQIAFRKALSNKKNKNK